MKKRAFDKLLKSRLYAKGFSNTYSWESGEVGIRLSNGDKYPIADFSRNQLEKLGVSVKRPRPIFGVLPPKDVYKVIINLTTQSFQINLSEGEVVGL